MVFPRTFIHPPSTLPSTSTTTIEPLQNTLPAAETRQELLQTRSRSPSYSTVLLSSPLTQSSPAEFPIAIQPPILPASRYQYIFNIDPTLALDEHYSLRRASFICQWDRHLPDLSPVYFSRLDHDRILSQCFTCGASYFFGMLSDLFLAEMLACLAPETTHAHYVEGSRYYTPLLHCSIMAFGAGFSDNYQIRAKETRAKFATQAKWWLDDEFREWNIGRMYTGMAVRATRAQCLMALETNRPSEMPHPHASISCPIAPESESQTDLHNHADYFKHSTECFIQTCRLMVIASQIIGQPVDDTQLVLDTHLQLETWFNALPESALIQKSSTVAYTPVLALHITYWRLILHSHRRLLEKNPSSTEPWKDLSLKMCSRATEQLVQIFIMFEQRLGWRYFPRNLVKAMYECGSALVKERTATSSASREKRATATDGVQLCIRALGIVGDVWPGAVRMRDELRTLAG
ncbi:hypothetical protein RSOL_251930 [Rhizoctonia solani AG-3 Rhs1AP]|uniref:Fungal specific transcription factor domain protein n=2 Tax=Rhizoctonia solani AG-3 TaxID=1086053 RepID=A0A074S341_9AGAM|nr:hypothetical protein RSOL_251930 [Rhizoctonia solani AG-3 Rhs1AP]KEP51278.1 hypothetical protein V565_064360 [Rhizoctonia solani 123E]